MKCNTVLKYMMVILMTGIACKSYAALFYLTNNTSQEILVQLTCTAGKCTGKTCKNRLCNKNAETGQYDHVMSREKISYSTDFDDLLKVQWIAQEGNVARLYEVVLRDKKLNALNLGGTFEIKENGAYTFEFGIDGREPNGEAEGLEITTSWKPSV